MRKKKIKCRPRVGLEPGRSNDENLNDNSQRANHLSYCADHLNYCCLYNTAVLLCLVQWCTTSGPRATSGPRQVLMWPATSSKKSDYFRAVYSESHKVAHLIN